MSALVVIQYGVVFILINSGMTESTISENRCGFVTITGNTDNSPNLTSESCMICYDSVCGLTTELRLCESNSYVQLLYIDEKIQLMSPTLNMSEFGHKRIF